MAETILFRGASVRYFDGRQEEGGAFVRIHMTADFSKSIIEKMEWEDPGHSATDCKMEGELHGSHFILKSNEKQLASHEIQFDIRSVEDFKVATVKDGESKRRELRFVVRSSAPGVAALVDDYIRRIGDHEGALKISYVKQEAMDLQPAQDDGPSTGAEEKPPIAAEEDEIPEDHCVSCENEIPMVGVTEHHTNGLLCRKRGTPIVFDEPALASATAVNGRRKRIGNRPDPEAERAAQVAAGKAAGEPEAEYAGMVN